MSIADLLGKKLTSSNYGRLAPLQLAPFDQTRVLLQRYIWKHIGLSYSDEKKKTFTVK